MPRQRDNKKMNFKNQLKTSRELTYTKTLLETLIKTNQILILIPKKIIYVSKTLKAKI